VGPLEHHPFLCVVGSCGVVGARRERPVKGSAAGVREPTPCHGDSAERTDLVIERLMALLRFT